MQCPLIRLAPLVLLALCAGCAILPSRVPSSPPASSPRSGPSAPAPATGTVRPYTVLGKTYQPYATAYGYREVGIASWYGSDFNGRPTANGETYNMYGVSAAHKLVPLGTHLKVTNLDNGQTLVVRVNDRGPFVGDRIIDLSYGAARRLGMAEQGLARVRLEAVDVAAPADGARVVVKSEPPERAYWVQIGSFAEKANARRMFRRLVDEGYANSRIFYVIMNGKEYLRVQAGAFHTREDAERALERLRRSYPDSFVTYS